MDFYILNNRFEVINIISVEDRNFPVFDDKFTLFLSNGSFTFDFKILSNDDIATTVIEKNYIMFVYEGQTQLCQIRKCKEVEGIKNVTLEIEADSISLELYNSHVRPTTIQGNVEQIFSYVLRDTNWKLGYISANLVDRVGILKLDSITPVYSVIQSLVAEFDNIEIAFRVECVDSISGIYEFYLDIFDDGERGEKTYKRFEYDWNIDGCTRTADATEFCTGLIGEGANGITFSSIRWVKSMGDPIDKPEGADYMVDPEAQELIVGDKPILGLYKSNTDSPLQLAFETFRKLQELKQTKFSYDIPIKMTSEKYSEIGIGDTVCIVNNKFNPPIEMYARIGKLELSFSNPDSSKGTFANYKPVKSKIKNIDSNTFVNDAIDALTGYVGKLTQADIAKITQFLADVGVKDDEINKILKQYLDKIPNGSTETPNATAVQDMENYRAIKLTKIDNGLWLGDDNIAALRKHGSSNVTTETPAVPNSASVKEYKNALAYYDNFQLGSLCNASYVKSMRSKSNPYKFYVLVPYWAKKFGLDPELVYAMIYGESSANPYLKTKYSGGGYGAMQCERDAYFNKRQTITFYDGTKRSFTPSYDTMNPSKGITITINGVRVNQNISNQIMFGCDELRRNAKLFNWNVFATITGYNFGPGGVYWCMFHYINAKYGLPIKGGTYRGLSGHPSKAKSKFYDILNDLKCPWSSYRAKYVSTFRKGTATNIEGYLRYYRIVDGQLPYFMVSGKKRGYGANKPANLVVNDGNTTTKAGVATEVRNKIVAKAKEICKLHQTYKKATYDQKYRIVNDNKRFRAPKTIGGISKPYCYDCSSLVSCSYNHVGLTSVYAKSCQGGSLVESATRKSGYKMWKCTKENLDNYAIPGDIIMGANNSVPNSPSASYYSGTYKTHHTLIYCGKVNGTHMVAHARKWDRHPNAIKYQPLYSDLYTYGIILRPWDLAKLDSEATKKAIKPTEKVVTTEVTMKGAAGASYKDFYADENLAVNIFNQAGEVIDTTKYPSTASHIFLGFNSPELVSSDIDPANVADDYISLIRLLLRKYPKKPIFVAAIPRVNSQYSGYEEKNKQIDIFNKAVKEYSYATQNVIQIAPPNEIMTADKKYINPDLTVGGWKLKDKASSKIYYDYYKNYILLMSTGGKVNSTGTTIKRLLRTQNVYTYKNPVKLVQYTLPSSSNQSYYSKLVFTTMKGGEPTKYKQPSNLYLQGVDCKKGQLIPKADTTYTLSIYWNPDTEIANTKYLGNVAAVKRGGKYASFDKFVDRKVLVSNAKTFYDNRKKLIYNNTTPADFKNPQDNKSKWTTNDYMHIDDSSFLNYIMMGHKFSTCAYGLTTKNDNNKNSAYSWALPSTRNEANIAKYFVEQGWIFEEADLTTYTNLSEGDILFMDVDSVNNNEFMGISHNAIVYEKDSDGDWVALECTNVTDPIIKTKVKNLASKNIVLIARIRKD